MSTVRVAASLRPAARSLQTPLRTALPVLRGQPATARLFQSAQALRMRQSPVRMFQTARRMMEVPKEEHSAHTISQRLRSLKKVPVELWPLGAALAVAVVAALYAILHKLFTDKTLRLTRSGGKGH